MSLYKKLLKIKEELNLMEESKENILKEGIDIKLNRIEDNYNKVIEANCNYILSRSNYKVFKAIEKYQKEKGESNEVNRGFIKTI